MVHMVKVSICIPAYNNELPVRRLLESIEKQNFKDYEVIITDDSVTDGIKKLAEEKSYVKYYKNPHRLGAAANWNAAISKACGEYIKIMHHDDWFTDENSLKEFVNLLEEHPEACLGFSGSRQEEKGKSYDRCISPEDAAFIVQDYRNLYLGNTIGAPSAVIVRGSAVGSACGWMGEDREEIVSEGENGKGQEDRQGIGDRKGIEERKGIEDKSGNKTGGKNPDGSEMIEYDEKLTWLVDMEYYMNLLKHTPHFIYTEKPLVSIGVGDDQLTEACRDNKELNVFEYGYIYKKYHLENQEKYRHKLLTILSDAGKSEKEAISYGLTKKEYRDEMRRKLISKIKWKLTHFPGSRTTG